MIVIMPQPLEINIDKKSQCNYDRRGHQRKVNARGGKETERPVDIPPPKAYTNALCSDVFRFEIVIILFRIFAVYTARAR